MEEKFLARIPKNPFSTTTGPRPIASLPQALTEAHVSGAAITAKRSSKPPYWGRTNTLLRAEPMWGDVDILTNILSRLHPHNTNKLLAAISTASTQAKALQIVRNGAAHNHFQNLNDVLSLRSKYITFKIAHPTHAMFWIEPQSSDFLIINVIETLKNEAYHAIS